MPTPPTPRRPSPLAVPLQTAVARTILDRLTAAKDARRPSHPTFNSAV